MLERIAAILFLLLLGNLPAGAKDFVLGSTGTLRVDLRDSWQQTRSPPDSLATISIEAKEPGRLHVLLTPIQVKNERDVRELVQHSADRIGPQSVEKSLTLQILEGQETKGYYFKATDPAPKAGEYRFLYQGAARVASLLVTFTVLYNEGAEAEAQAALSSIRGMRMVK